MGEKTLPSPEILRELLDYDPAVGSFVWKARSAKHFSDGVQKSADQLCAQWNKKHAGKDALIIESFGYKVGSVFGNRVQAHRVAYAIHFGRWPTMMIDHINGDRFDNRIANLREVSFSENAKNSKKSRRNKSGVTGVYRYKNVWRVTMCSNNKRWHVGQFESLDDAIAARKSAEREHGYSENHGR